MYDLYLPFVQRSAYGKVFSYYELARGSWEQRKATVGIKNVYLIILTYCS